MIILGSMSSSDLGTGQFAFQLLVPQQLPGQRLGDAFEHGGASASGHSCIPGCLPLTVQCLANRLQGGDRIALAFPFFTLIPSSHSLT
jgi:hypothetical protein